MSRKEYFAYGSNLNFDQMVYRCPEATVVGIAKLNGYELAFRRGYLTILPKEDASVEGLIWSITDHDESQLDCYEGYPTFYDIYGYCTDICVISNAMVLRAAFPETEIEILSDCCAGVTPQSHQTALDAMRACQFTIV